MTKLSPDPSLLESLSLCNIQYSALLSAESAVSSFLSSVCCIASNVGISTKKLANSCTLMLALGLYSVPCFPTLMAYLANHPNFSSFDRTWHIGWVVRISMLYAWKYLLGFRSIVSKTYKMTNRRLQIFKHNKLVTTHQRSSCKL